MSELMDEINKFAITLREAIHTTASNSLENDKALLHLGEVLTEQIQELMMRVHHLEVKVEMLHQLYHTHFADGVEEETKH